MSPYTILITFFFFFSRSCKRNCVLYQNKPHLLSAIPVENDLLYTQHRSPLTCPWRQEWNSRKSRAPTTDIDMLCTKSAMKDFWDKLQSPAGVSCTASMAHTATNTFIKHVAGGWDPDTEWIKWNMLPCSSNAPACMCSANCIVRAVWRQILLKKSQRPIVWQFRELLPTRSHQAAAPEGYAGTAGLAASCSTWSSCYRHPGMQKSKKRYLAKWSGCREVSRLVWLDGFPGQPIHSDRRNDSFQNTPKQTSEKLLAIWLWQIHSQTREL